MEILLFLVTIGAYFFFKNCEEVYKHNKAVDKREAFEKERQHRRDIKAPFKHVKQHHTNKHGRPQRRRA